MTGNGPMTRAVAEALKDAPTLPRDRAAVQLVRRYAQLLDAVRGTADEHQVYADLGPKLLAALTALGMTAAGRSKTDTPTGTPNAGNPLDELRARRERRRAGQH